MKSFKLFFALALVMGVMAIAVTPVFALTCKNGNYGSDECWTDAQMTTNDGVAIAGAVMVYDFTTPTQAGNSVDNASFYVRQITSNDQGNIVAGVAQKTLSSGDRVSLLVRGQGVLRTTVGGTVVSGDRLYPFGATQAVNNNQRGTASNVGSDRPIVASRDRAMAFALTGSTSSATIDAYITVY